MTKTTKTMGWLVGVEIFCDQRSKLLNFDFDHMFGLVNGFCDQKSERSELNRPSDDDSDTIRHGFHTSNDNEKSS